MSAVRPETIASAAQAVSDATRRLTQAAELAEADAIDAAVADRARALGQLQDALAATPTLPADDRAALLADIAIGAEGAESALRALVERSRDALATQARNRRAFQGYATRAGEPAALDREG